MSGELTSKLRLVRCPKCRVVLPEPPHYNVYKCGGCGATLQAKKRKNEAVNPESSVSETEAAPRNALNLVSEEKDRGKGKQPVLPQENVRRTKSTSSSSGDCSLDGNGGRDRNGNGESNVLPQENVLRTKSTSSSSGECSLDGNGGKDPNGNGESNVLPQENVLRTKLTSSSSGESSLDGGRDRNGNGESNVLPQENALRTKSTSSSSGECSLDRNGGRDRNGNKESNVLPQENVLRTKSTSSSSGECSLDGNGGRDRDGNWESNVLPQENVLRTKSTSSSPGECSLDENGGRDQNENGESSVLPQENVRRTKSTSSSSGECSLHENGREQNNNGECNKEHLDVLQGDVRRTRATSFSSEECSLGEIDGRGQNENGDLNVAFNLSDEDLENETETNNLSLIRFRQRKVSDKGGSTALTHRKIEASSALIGKSSVEETNDAHLQLAGTKGSDNGSLLLREAKEQLIVASDGVDANNDKPSLIEANSEVDITAKSLTNNNFASERGGISLATPCKPEEGGISGNPVSSNKQMKKAQESIPYNLDRVRSVDTFDTSEVINQSSELSGELGELSKSPTTRSSYAYDGSVSSYDGMDKRFPNKHSEDTYNVANVVSEGRHRKGKGPINGMNVPSDLPRGRHHVMEGTKRGQYKVLETTIRDRPARHWMRAEREGFPPRMPFRRNGSQSGYESDIPLNQMHDDEHYLSSSSILSHDYFEDSDQEKMKLLRMIYKLQNQLHRTSSLKEGRNRRFSTDIPYEGKRISASHSHDFHEERRLSHDLGDPWRDGRYNNGMINWRQSSKCSRIPFSAEATCSTHHVDNSCFHCHQQEWRYSTELPPHFLCQHEELYRYHPSHPNCGFSHRSYPPSAQRFMGSKPPLYGREKKPEDQRLRAYEMRRRFTEKQNISKRHYRPVAGGAPLVTCPNCSKLLQLPADFLFFKRVCHKLKCGSCSEILKFSLQNRSHMVSYAPRELDDRSEVINESNMASASRASHFHSSHAVPISYSDDYGHFVSKSCSSEDPVSLTQFNPLHGSEYDTNESRGNFEEEVKIASRHSRTRKTSMGTKESTRIPSNLFVSEKLSSEMEAPPPPPRSSPLHQLMGYSSPSQVIRGVQSSGEGNELMHYEQHDQ